MKKNTLSGLSFVFCGLFLALTAVAEEASDDLRPFVTNNGLYLIDPAEGPYCNDAYQQLSITVDASRGLVTQVFSGTGTLHGLPTAGEKEIEVSLLKTWWTPSFPFSAQQRIVRVGSTILEQTQTGGAAWQSGNRLLEFRGPRRVVVSQGGFDCGFEKIK